MYDIVGICSESISSDSAEQGRVNRPFASRSVRGSNNYSYHWGNLLRGSCKDAQK